MTQQTMKFAKAPDPSSPEFLMNSIHEGIPVLTVNVRLSRWIGREYDEAMRQKGDTVWQTPEIMTFSAWVRKLWEESWPEEALISDIRCAALWEQIISDDVTLGKRAVLMPRGVVKTALDAYRLIHEYRLRLPDDDIYLTEESRALKGWMRRYEAGLRAHGFIDSAHLPEEAAALIRQGRLTLPRKVILAGYDEITPQADRLLQALREGGSDTLFWPLSPGAMDATINQPAAGRITLRQYEDEAEEVVQAARWIRQVYRPGMRIGVIASDLNRYKGLIQREFAAELDPPSVFPWLESRGRFNISLGGPLFDEPVVHSTLQLLSVDAGRQDIHTLGNILLSPWFFVPLEEKRQLARLDAEIRKKNRLEISLAEVRALADSEPYEMPVFTSSLDAWMASLKDRSSSLPSRWVEELNGLMKEIGWPSGQIALRSPEYQALRSWYDILAGFSGLDDITGKITRADAVARLIRIAQEKLYQPESADCPVEVMGMLEASGMRFDRIRLLGAHEDALPGAPSPNPFIPVGLQKRHQLPRASCKRELRFSRAVLNRLLSCSDTIEASFPKRIDDKEVKASPLLAERVPGPAEMTEGSRYRDSVHQTGGLEERPAESPLPVGPGEMDSIGGGTLILKNYSDCPFRAFAVHRLHAQPLAEPEPGITALEKGNMAHKAMEQFWSAVKDSEGLQRLTEDDRLNDVIHKAVEDGIRKAHPGRPVANRFMTLEKERLAALLGEWIEVEKMRLPFATTGAESTREITVGGMTFRGRMDRIDRLETGGKLIIDYKTGISDQNDWLGDRPREPQLMLYSMTDAYDGVAFARLKRGECRFFGIIKEEGNLPGIKPFGKDGFSNKVDDAKDWEGLMEKWRETVTALAEGFMKGVVDVDPRDYGAEKSACRYCEQKALCRIFERETDQS